MAMLVDAICNELGITIPVAIHADHYGIKNDKDIAAARIEIPTMFEAGMTSIAIDASHLPDDKNLLASIALNPYVPKWAGFETEVGEIKGDAGTLDRRRSHVSHPGAQCPRYFPRLDCFEQWDDPRHRRKGLRDSGPIDRGYSQALRKIQGLRRPARNFRQQL